MGTELPVFAIPTWSCNRHFFKIKGHASIHITRICTFRETISCPPLECRRGLPIGNLTSEFFANVYLDPLDHFAKEILRAPYVRYVDDFALFDGDSDVLASWRGRIEKFLVGRRLVVHPTKTRTIDTKAPTGSLGFVLPGFEGRDRCGQRVLRGGAWNNNPRNVRTANRNRNDTANRNNHNGFRFASTPARQSRRDQGCGGRASRGPGPVMVRTVVHARDPHARPL